MKDVMLSLRDVSFTYPGAAKPAVGHFSLDVEEGSFTTLLGPSGCGKTTILNIIAGFLCPTGGSVLLSGKDQRGIAPEKREIGVVFQDYALFPHLTVRQNMLYGLKVRKAGTRDEMEAMVKETASNLDLEELLDRYPQELSGGQQQRVALARSLVLKPRVLLMDEPLSSLDTKLRVRVREELKEIQEEYGITTIYVTHDQEEALSLSDTIAVLENGRLLQTGSPEDLYFRPLDRFTADFIGVSNFIGDDLVRPEWFEAADDGEVKGTVKALSFLGEKTRLRVETKEGLLTVDLPTLGAKGIGKGDSISLRITHRWKVC